jgi:phosphotransferase system enzyme I (PtsP)
MITDPKEWFSTKDIATLSLDKALPLRDQISSEFVDAQVAFAAPRRIVNLLRDIMLTADSVEIKLDYIVHLIARELRADVCSCFVLRAGEVLELFAIAGLNRNLIHTTKLRVGNGLIGDIAAQGISLALPDAQTHPNFVAYPETGELAFKSFCGVPILRGGMIRGVLVIQNKLHRAYGEEVIEILQTIALILAEIIVTGAPHTPVHGMHASLLSSSKPTHISGLSLGRGLAIGQAVLYEPRLTLHDIVTDDVKTQKERLKQAVASMHDAIDRILHRNANLSGTETRDILEAYQMFARDRGWLARIENTIDKGFSAEAAVQRVLNETHVRMTQMSDSYIRERLQDMEDLSNRLLSHLMKQHRAHVDETLPDEIILVARSLGPAALLDYDHKRLKGVVLEKGSHSNHVAIVARSLGIPVVGQCGDILNFIEAGDQIIVDGEHGVVYLRPAQYVLDLYSQSIDARAQRTNLYRRIQHQQSVTQNGIKVAVHLNAGLLAEVGAAQAIGAEGIGLYRTELSFMGWQKYPLVATQAELYSKIMDQMGDKPVVFRTLDIGGDKPLSYFTPPEEEENPALGWRAVRIGMDRPAVLRTQFRAFIRGAKGRNLKIMLPLVTEVAEYDRAKALLEMEKSRALKHNLPVPDKIELGVMLEVPALIFQLDALLATVDFVSVGTNDLMQYLYAADRGNNAIRNRYDPLSPAMLQVLKIIADKCRAAAVPVSVCGEMAGNPLEAMVLIALGYENLSLSAQSIEAVKTMIPTLDTQKLLPYLEQLMQSREHSLRERLLSFAQDHQVNIAQDI